jgi:excisionase family DNA binding protein
MEIERLALRASEFAEAIGASRSKVYEMMADGSVPTVVIGGVRRIPVDAAKQMIADQLAMARKDGQ